MTTESSHPRQILYCGPHHHAFERLCRAMAGAAEVTATPRGLRFGHPRAPIEIWPAHTVGAALDVLDRAYVHLVLIDLRAHDRGTAERTYDERVASARRLLTALDDIDDPEARYGFHRIMVLVSAADGPGVDRLLVELGGFGIRHVEKEPPGAEQAFAGAVLDAALRLMLDREPSRTAICAAGGGITAIYFELGALKCLDDSLGGSSPYVVNGFDMYFGISAGAVVTSLLANGYSADEIMAAIAGVDGGRVPPLDLGLVRLSHLNLPDYGRRAVALAGRSARSMIDAARGRTRPTLEGAFLDLTAAVGAPFRSDRYERTLREILTRPGATNDFRELRRELYVGASNQDSRRHVLFGAERPDTAISRAVQASLSINPAFSAVEIDGAFYEDGAVTRTSNFTEAIKRGANFIVVLDPFVPYVSKRPGFANRRGMLFNVDQDIRSLSFTRFENARNWALRRYPEVRAYTFLPHNRLRRLLSANPMDHRPYMAIFRASYIGTLRRLRQIRHRLVGDLAKHGMTLDTGVAERIAARLEASDPPEFADFFLDGRVDIRRPPLARELCG